VGVYRSTALLQNKRSTQPVERESRSEDCKRWHGARAQRRQKARGHVPQTTDGVIAREYSRAGPSRRSLQRQHGLYAPTSIRTTILKCARRVTNETTSTKFISMTRNDLWGHLEGKSGRSKRSTWSYHHRTCRTSTSHILRVQRLCATERLFRH